MIGWNGEYDYLSSKEVKECLKMDEIQSVKLTQEQEKEVDNVVNDPVNHPSHYSGKVECIDCLEAATEGLIGIEAVCTANAIKYLYRWKRKNGKEDLLKAQWYINHLIKHIEGGAIKTFKHKD